MLSAIDKEIPEAAAAQPKTLSTLDLYQELPSDDEASDQDYPEEEEIDEEEIEDEDPVEPLEADELAYLQRENARLQNNVTRSGRAWTEARGIGFLDQRFDDDDDDDEFLAESAEEEDELHDELPQDEVDDMDDMDDMDDTDEMDELDEEEVKDNLINFKHNHGLTAAQSLLLKQGKVLRNSKELAPAEGYEGIQERIRVLLHEDDS
ncbi:hypothetical protein HDV03_000128 [Kappamyces sp. JEL0829]|nr:hypothetical protein HDV03_000128 [Kappamyces sp. JEL0829]